METRRNLKKNATSVAEQDEASIAGQQIIKFENEPTEAIEIENVGVEEVTEGDEVTTQEIYQEETYQSPLEGVSAEPVAAEEPNDNVEIVKIIPLPHARSEVWTYFGFVANEKGEIADKSKVVCKICASTFCYSGNTTNFYSHLKSMHSEVNINSTPTSSRHGTRRGQYKTTHPDDEYDYGGGYSGGSPNKRFRGSKASGSTAVEGAEGDEQRDVLFVDDITQAIVDFIVTDCRPSCVVRGKGFQRLLSLLVPDYTLPDRQQLKLAIRKRYDEFTNRDSFNDVERLL